jgi:hypothetical protein
MGPALPSYILICTLDGVVLDIEGHLSASIHRTQQLLAPLIAHMVLNKVHQVAPTLSRDALPSEPLHVWQLFAYRHFGGFLAVPALLFAGGRQCGQIGV